VPVPRRDLEQTRKQLLSWLPARLPKATEIDVSELKGPGATGFSSDTLLFDLRWTEAGREERRELVLRIEPAGAGIFPEYDVDLQFRVMRALAPTGIPVPGVLWQEADPSILGSRFYLMEQVAGRIPPDNPPYHAQGWMTEITAAERTSIWWSGLETLARIHGLDWKALDVLPAPQNGKTPLGAQLEYYRRFLAWAAQGGSYPASEQGLAWLERQRPREPEPTVLCWGDSRLGNMIFREGRCVAVIDWEMVTLGNPAQDVAWWLFFDEHHSTGCGLPRLEGIPGREESVARYEQWAGRPLQHLAYYDVFAAFRFSVIMIRVAQLLGDTGLLPAESDFGANNICTRMLLAKLERAVA